MCGGRKCFPGTISLSYLTLDAFESINNLEKDLTMSNPDSTAVPSSPGGSSGPSTQVLNPDGSVLGSYILTGTFAARPAPSGGWPIVLVYHGGGESAREILDYSQLGCLEAVVIGLQGQDAYNIPSWMNAFIWLKSSADRGLPRDDVQFTERVLADIARQQPGLPLDRSRIYATGKSDGAGMAVFLAAHPELRSFDLRLRAIAPISGAYFGVHESFAKRSFASPPSGIDYHEIILAPDSIPLLEMHGDADTVMPYEGSAIEIRRQLNIIMTAIRSGGHLPASMSMNMATRSPLRPISRATGRPGLRMSTGLARKT